MTPLILIVTRFCPCRCSYCPTHKARKFLNQKTALRAVALYLDALGDQKGTIKLFGGEPLSHLNVVKSVVCYAKDKRKDINIELATNGLLLDGSLMEWMKSYGIDLSVSIDGDETTHLKNRNITRNQYQKIVRLVKEEAPNVTVNMVVAPNTVTRFFHNFSHIYNIGVKKINILPAAYIPWKKNDLMLLNNQLALIALFIQGHREIYVKNKDIRNNTLLFNTGLVVDYDGTLFFTNAIMADKFKHLRDSLCFGNIEKTFSLKKYMRNESSYAEKTITIFNNSLDNPTRAIVNQLDRAMDYFCDKIDAHPSQKSKRLDIKIGFQCNNHCLFCVQGDKRKKIPFKSVSDIKNDLNRARQVCDSIVFTGGEPTLHPSFLDLVRFSKKLDFKIIQIQTNARMFAYKDFCYQTIRAGANEFSPALHGHTASLHDCLTTVQGSFDQTTRGIKNLKRMGQYVISNTVVNTMNYRYLARIARLLVMLGVDQYQFAFVHIAGSAWRNKNSIVPKKSDVIPYLMKGLDVGIAVGKKVMVEAIPYCLMKGYEQYVAEQHIPEAMVIDDNFRINDYTHYRQRYGKKKNKTCVECEYFSICEGPWKEYPQMYGWGEFVPTGKIL